MPRIDDPSPAATPPAIQPDTPALVVAFAAAGGEAARQALHDLRLPGLQRLLHLLQPAGRDDASELTLTPPHERAWARERGWRGADGTVPLAAWLAQDTGLDGGLDGSNSEPWCLLTPVHLHMGTEQVSMLPPEALQLDALTSRQLFDAIHPLFDSEGLALHWLGPQQWLARHPMFDGLPTASLDRVIGRNVDRWLPDAPQARLLRRLQNEVQMVLYTHALNDERERRGQLSVNSIWASGSGRAPVSSPRADVATLETGLRAAALGEDWAAWREAWQALDAGTLRDWAARAEAGEPLRLVLCGERSAAHFECQPRSLWQRWRARWNQPEPTAVLESL